MKKIVMSVAELAQALGISKPKAYELVKQDDFPALFIGKRIIIPIEPFNIWLINSSRIKI